MIRTSTPQRTQRTRRRRGGGDGCEFRPPPRSFASSAVISCWGGSLTATPSTRRGLSLLEVLVSIGILTLGVLGVAMLIPIGKFAMTEVEKSDRTGMCGRAALREVKIRKMLDPGNWAPAAGTANFENFFILDPLGFARTGGTMFGGTFTRLSLQPYPGAGTALTQTQAAAIFRWQDDLSYASAKESTTRTNGDRPMPVLNGTSQQSDGNCSWFLTVVPSVTAGVPWRQFSVSVVVCWKRAFTTGANDPNAGETAVPNVTCDAANGYGGIGISYQSSNVIPKENEWALLYTDTVDPNDPTRRLIKQATWYRVVAAGGDGAATPTTHVSLVGPDWSGGGNGGASGTATLIVVKGVTGVYSKTIALDNDATWSR
jgi:hypothetical protein